MLSNISIAYPVITKFIANCYMEPARLFVEGNHEIKSREGTTQDPTAMGAYALGVTPLTHSLRDSLDNDRILLSLPVRFGGLAIPLFHNDAKYEYENSR